jgi:dethiobiotin synthetase
MGLAAILVSGTDTAVGKTKITCDLARALMQRSIRVGVMKPVETGCEATGAQLAPADALALRAASGCQAPLETICPYRYRAQLAPAAAAEADRTAAPDFGVIRNCFAILADAHEIVLVEGAGGLAVPITWEKSYADLALELNLKLILVIGNRLGCINSAVLSFEYGDRRGLRLGGYILNDADPQSTLARETNAGSLRRLLRADCLGEVGYRQSLTAESVDRIASLSRR